MADLNEEKGGLIRLDREDESTDAFVCSSPEELEWFFSEMIPDRDKLWGRCRNLVHDHPQDIRRFRPHKERKSQVHVWLSLQENPHQIRQEISKGTVCNTALDRRFVTWSNEVFELPNPPSIDSSLMGDSPLQIPGKPSLYR